MMLAIAFTTRFIFAPATATIIGGAACKLLDGKVAALIYVR